ncbi:flagellar hook-length control protein FliK [Desulfallas sp. Bu1-1]|uniref:flagellar hook-length control protein FliK n=1 Tax=Desulfallas sp. Bu1-1 TaxID=2787620 RepID=UPI00189CD70F|nr:flagellar hook-length control protein FliK [Desulfallas sp. Bu1-1]MBF7083466.1 flagellar hook-length control protein FliK [Desulfallas sp. Bu1-1]
MHVSSIIPVLLNIILSEQQSRKKASREQVISQTTPQMRPQATAAAETKTEAEPRQWNAAAEPSLFPLPLKSPLFPDTQFFVFHRYGKEKNKQQDGESETGIVFSLATASLGRLFFLITSRPETVNITCHVENAEIAARLNARSAELEQQVRKTGFKRVVLRWTVLEHSLAGPQKDFTTPGLLDRKV